MNDAMSVRDCYNFSYLPHERHAGIDGERASALEALFERLPFEELHHDIGATVGRIADIENLNDAGMANTRRRLRLLEEPLHNLLVNRHFRQ